MESLRTADGVRQRTLLDLGRHFDVPRERWAELAQRIEQLTGPQETLGVVSLAPGEEELAQRCAARVIHARSLECSARCNTIRPARSSICTNAISSPRP